MNALCHHTLMEFYDCDPVRLSRSDDLRGSVLAAVKKAQGTIVTDVFHNFSPQGVSGVVVIAESHVTLHTWPEHQYAAVDVFSCSHSVDHLLLERLLAEAFASKRVESRSFPRGYPKTAERLQSPAVRSAQSLLKE